MENLIIGGGLSGLIYAYYNKDFKIIADKIGGQATTSFNLGPRLLQIDDTSKQLLSSLGFKNFLTKDEYDYNVHPNPMFIKVAKVGYNINGIVTNKPTNSFRSKYFIQSRCLEGEAEVIMPESAMSGNQKEIKYYDITHEKLARILIDVLAQEHRIYETKVEQIDIPNDQLYIYDGKDRKTLKYNKLVNTIPFPIFFSLCNPFCKVEDFDVHAKYFIEIDKYIMREYISDSFDYIYFVDHPWNRLTVGENTIIVECTGEDKYNEFHSRYKNIKWNSFRLPCGQIEKSVDMLTINHDGVEIENIRMLGRYATWNHSTLIQDVIRRSMEGLWI